MKSTPVRLLQLAVVVALSFATPACSPSSDDILRMRNTDEDGPRRLAAVVRDGKGSLAVQKDAALALVTLTRNGRHVGLDLLVEALAARPTAKRGDLLSALSRELVQGMAQPRGPTEDPALAYKDGAHAIVSSGVGTSTAPHDALVAALGTWLRESPFERLDDVRQRYGLTSLLHLLGPEAPQALLRFMEPETWHRALDLVMAEGDDPTKHRAFALLDGLVRSFVTPAWREKARELIEAANKKSNVKVTPAQLEIQVTKYRSNELTRAFVALGKTGYSEALDTLLAAAEDTRIDAPDRTVALARLAAHAFILDARHVDRLFALGLANPPRPRPGDRDEQALRLSAAEHDLDNGIARHAFACIVHATGGRAKLLGLIVSPPSWGMRTEATYALLDGASVDDAKAILAGLPSGTQTAIGRAEVHAYGYALARIKGGKDLARGYLAPGSAIAPRLASLSAFVGERDVLAPYEHDVAALPRCSPADRCEWTCNGTDVTTVGEYVRACLEVPERSPSTLYGGGGHEVTPVTDEQLLKLLGGGADAGREDGRLR